MFNNVPKLDEVIELSIQGFTVGEIVVLTGVTPDIISTLRRTLHLIHKRRLENTAKPFWKILYVDSVDWVTNKPKSSDSDEVKRRYKNDHEMCNHLLDFSCLIIDARSGVSLYHVVRKILLGFSFKKLAYKFQLTVPRLQDFLATYENVII